jgi:hypothetical protein
LLGDFRVTRERTVRNLPQPRVALIVCSVHMMRTHDF